MDLLWPPRSREASSDVVALSLLRGCALVDTPAAAAGAQQQSFVRHFPQWRLHHEPAKRFRQLFACRARWLKDDLMPFLEAVCAPEGPLLDDLLLAHARSTVVADNKRLFSAK